MKYAFAKRVRHLQSSAVREILKVVSEGNVISFAGGLPEEDLFPMEEIKEAFEKVFSSGKKSLQYIETEGYRPLREILIERMKKKGISGYTAEEVLLTTDHNKRFIYFQKCSLIREISS
ncbi:hypothetical protein [Caldalkalibacillus thermarum]|uniref:hypothetical protein n=1 Tax=Caldalkalibacillus thermarum TaxID=296745 RepID=UPI00280B7CBF|nr:hypothetical protein [Caldalkalibacillus thermarum]